MVIPVRTPAVRVAVRFAFDADPVTGNRTLRTEANPFRSMRYPLKSE
jgi:hypothetical protein